MAVTGARDDSSPAGLPEAPLTVAAVAHRLGVAPATLRTWDRRYGLGPTDHEAGAHRRYSAHDVARLHTMRRLTLQGVPPAAAAQAALGTEPAAGSGRVTATPLPDREGRLAAPSPSPSSAQPGGGRVLPLPGAQGAVRGLGRAAMALDAPAVRQLVRAELVRRGVAATWDEVLRPVLAAVGARWAATGQGVEVEHLLSDCVAAALRELAPRGEEGARPVLLACAPDDQHALPLHVLGAALAERGHAARTLGAATPADALSAAVRRTGPAAVFVWSQLSRTADPDVLTRLPTTRPATALLVGGPGWVGTALPPRVARADDLKSAVALVEQALGA